MIRLILVLATAVAAALLVLTTTGCGGDDNDAPRPAGDNNAGDTSGQGLDAFGGGWFVVSPAGEEIASTGAGNGGSGY